MVPQTNTSDMPQLPAGECVRPSVPQYNDLEGLFESMQLV
jgi:hypothetical protein